MSAQHTPARPAAQLHPLAEAIIAAITAQALYRDTPCADKSEAYDHAEQYAETTRDRALAAFADIGLSRHWVAMMGEVF